MRRVTPLSRREFLARSTAAAAGVCVAGGVLPAAPAPQGENAGKALVAITLDLEMSRNFPTWETAHWDYEKGNLNDETKKYAAEAARRVKARGGVVHFFLVGRTLEQENVEWLREIARGGHPVGNHTYDHVNVLATNPEDIQYRFKRAPWLIEGKTPAEVIRENIRLTTAALKTCVGVGPAGFRTPGGFLDGLNGRGDVQTMLKELGFGWVSSKYPAPPMGDVGREPTAEIYDGIVKAQRDAQPFAYPDSGLVEVPMSPVSDIGAFRGGRWKLEWFLESIRRGVGWAIENRAVYDFLGHPSCLYVTDPEFRAVNLICDLVDKAGDAAALVGLDAIAMRAPEK